MGEGPNEVITPAGGGGVVPAGRKHNVGMERVRRNITKLEASDGKPVAVGDFPEVAAVRHRHGPAVLLFPINVIWKLIVGNNVVELPRRLIEPRAPRPP